MVWEGRQFLCSEGTEVSHLPLLWGLALAQQGESTRIPEYFLLKAKKEGVHLLGRPGSSEQKVLFLLFSVLSKSIDWCNYSSKSKWIVTNLFVSSCKPPVRVLTRCGRWRAETSDVGNISLTEMLSPYTVNVFKLLSYKITVVKFLFYQSFYKRWETLKILYSSHTSEYLNINVSPYLPSVWWCLSWVPKFSIESLMPIALLGTDRWKKERSHFICWPLMIMNKSKRILMGVLWVLLRFPAEE